MIKDLSRDYPTKAAELPACKAKNRYTNILPCKAFYDQAQIETERDRDRDRERQRHRQTDRQTEAMTEREREPTDGQTYQQSVNQTDRQTEPMIRLAVRQSACVWALKTVREKQMRVCVKRRKRKANACVH